MVQQGAAWRLNLSGDAPAPRIFMEIFLAEPCPQRHKSPLMFVGKHQHFPYNLSEINIR
jgi:hypothetical protein